MSSKSKSSKEVAIPHLGFYPAMANTEGWVSYGMSLYRAKCNDTEASPEQRTFLDLSETIASTVNQDTAYPRYRVLATTADPECLSAENFIAMLETQQKDGHPRRVNFDQIWAIRDHLTSEIFICSPDVFVKMDGDTTTSARNKRIHIFRVYPTWMAMEIVALLRRGFLGSKDAPPSKNRGVPSKDTILTQMKKIIESKGGPEVTHHERRKMPNGTFETTRTHKVPNFSVQVAKNVYMPVCPTSFLHQDCPDLENPDPKKKLKGPTVSSGSRKEDDSDSEGSKPAKRQRTATSSRTKAKVASDDDEQDHEEEEDEDEEEQVEVTHSRAKRGRELASVGALINDDTDVDEPNEEANDPADRLGKALRELSDVVPDNREVSPVEIHRQMALRFKKQLPRISSDALDLLKKHLKVDDYDNSDLVEEEAENELSKLRRKTGVPKDMMLPVHAWPVLLHCMQDEDASIHSFVTNAPTALSRAGTDWGKQVLRPTSCNQIPKDWSGLTKAYILGAGAAISQYETLAFSVISERVENIAAEAQAVIGEFEAARSELGAQSAKLREAEAEIEAARAREATLLARIAELEAVKKLPPLPPPKKMPRDNDF